MKLVCMRVSFAGFILGDLAYAVSKAAGLLGGTCLGNGVGGFPIGVDISLALGTKISLFTLGLIPVVLAATSAVAFIGGGIIIIILIAWWWVNSHQSNSQTGICV